MLPFLSLMPSGRRGGVGANIGRRGGVGANIDEA